MKSNTIQSSVFHCQRQDLRIWGKQYIPQDNHTDKYPAIIISHEFLVNASYETDRYAQLLSKWGYATFVFDFCGGSKNSRSQGQSLDMTVFTEVDDLHAVLDYVKSLDTVDSSQIYLMGNSQGGFVSALVASQRPQDVKGLVLFYPALCIPDYSRQGDVLGSKFDPHHIPESVVVWNMAIGKNYFESVMDLDAYKAISAYQGPVLITHGTSDGTVPYDFSVRAKEAYSNCELVLINGAGHGYRGVHDKIALDALKKFLKS